jgi:ribonuclease P protein component
LSRQFGFRREQRLGRRDVALALASSRRFRQNALLVQIRENGLDLARLGLIVPKRYLPSSVDRNLVKRQAREWFRTRQKTLMGKDVLIRLTGPRQDLRLVANDLARLSV